MKKILIIEDEVSLRKGIAEILTFEGYEVKEADNGKDGVILALKYLPDLILCDIMMPEMDGREVVKQLNSNDNTKFIPFVFMTALAEKSDFRLGMELGADDYISKPFSREILLKAIEKRFEKLDIFTKKGKDDMDDLRKRIISQIPHELLTPLNGIIGFSQIISENAYSMKAEEIIEMSKYINESGYRLLSLIKHYIIYIQIINKKKSDYIKTELSNTYDTISQISVQTASRYKRLNDLHLDLIESNCNTDIEEFKIIVNELVDNAFKFSESDSKVIINSKSTKDFFELSIYNTGRIFPSDIIESIGAFIQFDRDKFEQQGSGLGLIICKLIIENYSGKLLINSNKKDGTTIIVRFPY